MKLIQIENRISSRLSGIKSSSVERIENKQKKGNHTS